MTHVNVRNVLAVEIVDELCVVKKKYDCWIKNVHVKIALTVKMTVRVVMLKGMTVRLLLIVETYEY